MNLAWIYDPVNVTMKLTRKSARRLKRFLLRERERMWWDGRIPLSDHLMKMRLLADRKAKLK